MTTPFKVTYAGAAQVPTFRLGLEADNEALGVPIVAWETLDDGSLVPGPYRIDFDDVVPGVSATALVTPPTKNYVRHDARTKAVSLTGLGGDWQYGVVDGMRFKFSDDPGFLDAWWARMHCGPHYGTFLAGNPSGELVDWRQGYGVSDPLDEGPKPGLTAGLPVGSTSWWGRWRIENQAGKTARNCFAHKVATAFQVRVAGAGLRHCLNTGYDIVEKLAYVVAFENLTGNKIDMTVDGALLASGVVDLVNGGAPTSSAQLERGRRYRVDTGLLKGWQFEIDPETVDGGSLLLFVIGARWGQITPDSGGAVAARPDDGVEDGTTWGTSPVGLTESASYPREVTDGAAVYIQELLLVPAGAEFSINPAPQGFLITAGLSLPATYGAVTLG
jgi:hypothetical protein